MTDARHDARREIRRLIKQAIDDCERVLLASQVRGLASEDDALLRNVEIVSTLLSFASMVTLASGVTKAEFIEACENVFDLVERTSHIETVDRVQ
jgi:hypothetical protein